MIPNTFKKITIPSFVIGLIFMATPPVFAAVWETTAEWDDRWEETYSAWVETHWVSDIFTDYESPYYGVKTDCADASYFMRLIFSYENGLPFAIKDATNYSSKRVISNKMGRWDGVHRTHQRVIRFMNYLSGIVGTVTLPEDTYPISINRNYFRPGIIYVTPKDHSYQVKELTSYGTPLLTSSTVPFSAKLLSQLSGFSHRIPKDLINFRDGFRAFRQPDDLFKSQKVLKGYSLEQFRLAKESDYNQTFFTDTMIKKLALEEEPLNNKTRRYMFNICDGIRDRQRVVVEAQRYYLHTVLGSGRQCMNASEYDLYSTPSRDHTLGEMYLKLQRLVESDSFKNSPPFIFKGFGDRLFNTPDVYKVAQEHIDEFCPINVSSTNKQLTIASVWELLKEGRLSSNPNDPLAERWGQTVRFESSERCPLRE